MQLCRVPAEFGVLWKFADENKAKKIQNLMRTLRRNATRRKVLSFLFGNWQIRITCRLANMKLSIWGCLLFNCLALFVEAENEPRLKFHFDLKRMLRQIPFQELWEFRWVRSLFLEKRVEKKSSLVPLKFEQYRMLLFCVDFPSRAGMIWKKNKKLGNVDIEMNLAVLRCLQF